MLSKLMVQRCGGFGFWKMDRFRFCMDNFPEWVLAVRFSVFFEKEGPLNILTIISIIASPKRELAYTIGHNPNFFRVLRQKHGQLLFQFWERK
jgi:hypothetical protein